MDRAKPRWPRGARQALELARRPAPGTRESRPDASRLSTFAQFRDDGLERGDDFRAIDFTPLELQAQVEGFRRRVVFEHVGFGAPELRLRNDFARLLTCRAAFAALAGQLLEQRNHFLRRLLPNHLQKQ